MSAVFDALLDHRPHQTRGIDVQKSGPFARGESEVPCDLMEPQAMATSALSSLVFSRKAS